eukprot:1321729-Amorphochlora_amoeboformis.AAC.1
MRDVPHGAVQVVIPFLTDALPGAIGGAAAAYVTTPADVMVTNFATYQETINQAIAAAAIANDPVVSAGKDIPMGPALTMEASATPLQQQSLPTPPLAPQPVEVDRPSIGKIGKQIVDKEGWEGFMVGGIQRTELYTIRIAYYGPMSGVFFGLYEALDRIFYPVLLPTLSAPLYYNLNPQLANIFEGAE